MKKLKVLDLFSGIGGFSLGLEKTGGFETVAFCEQDIHCQKVLRKHWPDVQIHNDVKELNVSKLKKLTQEQVNESVSLYEKGFSLQQIGSLWGVSRQSMHDLFKRRIELRPQKRVGKDNHFYRGGVKSDPKVHDITEKAILKGILTPEPCEHCGSNGKMKDGRNEVQAHHDNYNKPLDVRWLCQKCHHEWHKVNTPIKRKEVVGNIDVIVGGFPC